MTDKTALENIGIKFRLVQNANSKQTLYKVTLFFNGKRYTTLLLTCGDVPEKNEVLKTLFENSANASLTFEDFCFHRKQKPNDMLRRIYKICERTNERLDAFFGDHLQEIFNELYYPNV